MPVLEEMNIRDCCLKGCGPELAEIIKSKSFHSAEFVGAELSKEDGQILRKSIQDGSLDHMEYLNLLDNEEISWLKMDFAMACNQHEIHLEMFFIQGNAGKDGASSLANLESTFTLGQVQTLKSLISSFTIKQKQSVEILLSSLSAQQAKTISTVIANFIQDKSQSESPEKQTPEDTGKDVASPLATLAHSFIKEQVGKDAADVVKIIVSSLNPEQALNMMTFLPSFTPEQLQMMKTFISSLTSEQCETVKNLISNFTPEQVQIVKALLSEEKQNKSSSGEQLENPTNEAQQRIFDFSAIRNNVSSFFTTENSADQDKPQEPIEDSQQDDGLSHHERKCDDYVDDLGLD